MFVPAEFDEISTVTSAVERIPEVFGAVNENCGCPDIDVQVLAPFTVDPPPPRNV
jgi:hypothetical protein